MKQYIDEETKSLLVRLRKKGIIEKDIDYDNKAIEIIKELRPFFKETNLEPIIHENKVLYEKNIEKKKLIVSKIFQFIEKDVIIKRRLCLCLLENLGLLNALQELWDNNSSCLKYIKNREKRLHYLTRLGALGETWALIEKKLKHIKVPTLSFSLVKNPNQSKNGVV